MFQKIKYSMEKRINYSSGAKWEDLVGYSRAVKIGNIIEIAGTTAINHENKIVGKGDAYLQAKFIFEKIRPVLENLGASYENVIRTRIYLVDINDWELVGKAHGEVFGKIKPAATMLEISKLIDPELLVEIELSAVL
jgi:enamine deaminase RidA (YjgF/YER057c/UK114 family)